MRVLFRVAAVESRQKEVGASLSAAVSATAALPALESAINTRLPELEGLVRQQDIAHRSLAAKLPDVDTFLATVRAKLPELDTALKVADARVVELERKAINADRITRVSELCRGDDR
jgi:hypothetical protein